MNMSRALAPTPDGMVQAFQQSANILDNIVIGARPQELPQQQYRSLNIGECFFKLGLLLVVGEGVAACKYLEFDRVPISHRLFPVSLRMA